MPRNHEILRLLLCAIHSHLHQWILLPPMVFLDISTATAESGRGLENKHCSLSYYTLLYINTYFPYRNYNLKCSKRCKTWKKTIPLLWFQKSKQKNQWIKLKFVHEFMNSISGQKAISRVVFVYCSLTALGDSTIGSSRDHPLGENHCVIDIMSSIQNLITPGLLFEPPLHEM